MFDLKEFNGTPVTEPYSVNSFDELERQILKEIVFYGSGFGWSTASNEVEDQYILVPYAEKECDESSEDYIKNLKFVVGAEIRYRHCVTRTFNAIKDFNWPLEEVTDNKDFFVLIVFKM